VLQDGHINVAHLLPPLCARLNVALLHKHSTAQKHGQVI
jgi:hypothetical protein